MGTQEVVVCVHVEIETFPSRLKLFVPESIERARSITFPLVAVELAAVAKAVADQSQGL